MRPLKDILFQAALTGLLAFVMGFVISLFVPLMDYFAIVVGLGTFVGNVIALTIVDYFTNVW
jgi:hypothetical protein